MHHPTMFLAALIGISMLVTAIAMLTQKRATLAAIDGMMKDRPLLFALGFIMLIAGIAMILVHNIWTGGALPVIVTIVGWWTALKGALLLLLPPEMLNKLYKTANFGKNYYGFAIIALALGVLLTYAGFWG